MKYLAIVVLVLVVCAYFAWQDHTAGPDPLERVLERPAGQTDLGGTKYVLYGQAPSGLADLVEPGHVTVVALVSDACGGCKSLKREMPGLQRARPDVAVRYVDLGRNWHGVDPSSRFGISLKSIPHVLVYAPDGTLITQDEGRDKDGLDLLVDWINAEVYGHQIGRT